MQFNAIPRSVSRRGSSRFVAALQGLFLVAVRRSVSVQSNGIECNSMEIYAIQCNSCNFMQFNAIPRSVLRRGSPQRFNAIQCNSMQFNATHWNPMQFNAIQCNSMRPNAIRCDSMQFNKIQCNSMQLNGIQRSVPRRGSSQRFKVCSASRFVAAFECNPMLLHAINVIQWNSMQFKGLFLVAVRRCVPRSVPRRGSSQRGKVCFSSRFVATLQGLFLVAVRRSVSV
jgi:hypothetical protein